jgi:hypothetical protein
VADAGSSPTPTIIELARVVVREAVGALPDPFPCPTAPIAPAPLLPEGSTPVKLITVMEDVTPCDNDAVTETLVRGTVENARHISAVPPCTCVLATSVQFSPAPEIL